MDWIQNICGGGALRGSGIALGGPVILPETKVQAQLPAGEYFPPPPVNPQYETRQESTIDGIPAEGWMNYASRLATVSREAGQGTPVPAKEDHQRWVNMAVLLYSRSRLISEAALNAFTLDANYKNDARNVQIVDDLKRIVAMADAYWQGAQNQNDQALREVRSSYWYQVSRYLDAVKEGAQEAADWLKNQVNEVAPGVLGIGVGVGAAVVALALLFLARR